MHLLLNKKILTLCSLILVFGFMILTDLSYSKDDGFSIKTNAAFAQQNGNVPGNVKGNQATAEYWRSIKGGVQGKVSIPDKKAGVLVQTFGDDLRNFRNDEQKSFGAYVLGGMVVFLVFFYALRGKVMIESGLSGRTVIRFNEIERFGHWLMASSFVLLALTGLNTMYGKYILMPAIGKSAFSAITYYGKISHNFIGFAFMVGLALTIILWIKDNIPGKIDIDWLMVGGGLFTKGVHPPSKKFNAGQKIMFWAVSLGGISVAFTGICLMIPFEFSPFETTFMVLNSIGFDLPTNLTVIQETQYALLWHGIMAVALTGLIIAHIYIGSIGMEGAYDAMGTGEVDENWAREHHGIWLEEKLQENQEKPAE